MKKSRIVHFQHVTFIFHMSKNIFGKIAKGVFWLFIFRTAEDGFMSIQNPIFIPGPTNMPDRLRLAMHVQTQDHRAPDFVETFSPVLLDTK
ncbi:MAG: serine--glyoxylate aminotransferase, partial [Pseudomonadota bacterium]